MADFFTHFSCVLDVGTPDNAARPRALPSLQRGNRAGGRALRRFLLSIQPEHGGTALCICDEVTGDPQQVILFVQRCAEAFGLTGRWGFQWANTCSRPRVNAFGGGAHVLDLATGETIAWIDTNGWLARSLASPRGKRGRR
jgi:hypothetical protein